MIGNQQSIDSCTEDSLCEAEPSLMLGTPQ
jgi:hypothetical protein